MSEIHDKLDQYIIGKLDDVEKAELEQRISEDTALQDELIFRRKLISNLAFAHREDLKKKFSNFSKQNNTPQYKQENVLSNIKKNKVSRRIKFLLFFTIVLVISYVFWCLFFAKEERPMLRSPKPKSILEEPIALEPESSKVQQPEQSIPTETEAPDTKSEKKDSVSITKNKLFSPIVKVDPANFKPNAAWEVYLSGVRDASLNLEMFVPKNDDNFALNNQGETIIRFSGSVNIQTDLKSIDVLILIFNNQDINTSIITLPVILRKIDSNKMFFDLLHEVKLAPGLYYFTIELKEESQAIYDGSFTIGK